MRHEACGAVVDSVALVVNGRAVSLWVPRDAPLLTVLRNDLQLNAPKYGCGLGECGACTVFVDGVEARACVSHNMRGRLIGVISFKLECQIRCDV